MTRATLVLLFAVAACGGDKSDPPKPASKPEPVAAKPAVPVEEIAQAEADRDFGLDKLETLARGGGGEARALAIRGIGRTGGERAVKLLRELLGDKDEAIRVAAIGALSLASAEDAAGDVAARFGSASGMEKLSVVEALGRIGGADEQKVLIAALGDADASVQASAAVAMGVHGRRKVALTDAAVEALLRTTDTTDDVRYGRLYALARQHEPKPDERIDKLLIAALGDEAGEHRSTAVMGLARRWSGVEHIGARVYDPDPRVQVQAVRGLSGPKSDRVTREVLARWAEEQWRRMHRVGAALESPRIQPVIEALIALRPHAKEKAVRDALRSISRGIPYSKWAITPAQQRSLDAVTCLATAAVGTAKDVLACGAEGDAWPAHLRRSLAASVAKGATLDKLLRDSDPRVRAAALETVGKHKKISKVAKTAIATAFSSESPVEIGTVVDALGERNLDAVRARSDRELRAISADAELLVGLFGALEKGKRPEDADGCIGFTGHWNRTVREAAHSCVKALSGVDPKLVKAMGPPKKPPVNPAGVIGKRVLWKVTTPKGSFEIELDPEAAPWHVAVLTLLSKNGFYDGLLWHRVVGDFVVQGGDPTGSGWGGPGYLVPAEPSVPSEGGRYDRGAVGIADAGLDTGGCQIFIMHSRAPHLEGRYTKVGQVTKGMEVVDALIVGDTIDKIEVQVLAP